MKELKNIVLILLSIYISAVFITFEFDIISWSESGRFQYLAASITLYILIKMPSFFK
jgi:hypothetical protein